LISKNRALDWTGRHRHHPPRHENRAMLNNIETIICLLLLFMGVPDLCRKLGRPALGYAVFVLIGLAIAPFEKTGVRTMLQEAGEVGFALLLFEVGLEIDLPRPRELIRPLQTIGKSLLFQYPLILLVGGAMGLNLIESLIAAAALTSCSMSMAHGAWKQYPLPDNATRLHILHIMVLLELIGVVLLSAETVVLDAGLSWRVPLKLLGIGVTVLLVARFSTHVNRLFQFVLEKTTHWRVHFLVLLVLIICALGERLGLSAAKTAFVLGLFMSRIEHDGKGLEEYMAPISRRFLIPIFFVALGMQVPWRQLFTANALLAFGTAGLLLGFREMIHRRWLKTGGDRNTFLLFTPNLTIVALAASALLQYPSTHSAASWLLLTGLFMSVLSLFLLPQVTNPPAEAAEPIVAR
jgi:Kef-type K+ transport system membrane component KefB